LFVKQELYISDLRQLRPVAANYVFGNLKGELGHLIGNPLWESFSCYELTEIMRQRDDAAFAEALNRLAKCDLTLSDIEMFKGRQTNVTEAPPSAAIRLFYSNKDVDEYNEKCLNSMQTEGAVSIAADHCEGKGKEAWRTALLESAANLTSREAMGLPSITKLKVGAKYMMTLNVEVFDGLVNGATGILKKISYGESSGGAKKPIAAWLSFPETRVGVKRRKQFRQFAESSGVKENWIPIILERRVIKTWPGRDLQVNIPCLPY
jgi:hypothetical protein